MKYFALIGVLLVTVLAYQGVRQNEWVYEDTAMRIVAEGDPGLSVGVLGRNAARLSVWYPARWFGPSPVVQHVIQVSVHLLNGLLLFWVLRQVVKDVPALVGMALFLWAPIQVETAAYVASRPDLLMTTAILVAVGLTVGLPVPTDIPMSFAELGRSCLRGTGIILAVFLAISAKQTGVLVVPFLMLIRWVKEPDRRLGWAIAIAGCVACGLTLIPTIPADAGPLPYNRFWTAAYQSAAFWSLAGLVMWPHGFTIDMNIGAIAPIVAWMALAGVIGLAGLAWFVRRTHPILMLALVWLLLQLSPRFVLSLPEYLNQHQFYPAMLAVSLLLGLLITSTKTLGSTSRAAPHKAARRLAVAITEDYF